MVNGYYPTLEREALTLRRTYPDARLIIGGTDAMVAKKEAEHVIFLNQVTEFSAVSETDGILSIGASVTYDTLLHRNDIPDLLKQAMIQVASPAIRNSGTITGNICNASPAGDTLPVLYLMDAMIVKSSLSETGELVRVRIPIADFILGVRKIALDPSEIVTSIEIPVSSYQNITKSVFEKTGARKAEAISKLSFAGSVRITDGRIEDFRIAFGSVAVTVVRDIQLESEIIGLTLEEYQEKITWIVEEYGKRIHPIDDQRSTAAYRRTVCLNLLRHFLEE